MRRKRTTAHENRAFYDISCISSDFQGSIKIGHEPFRGRNLYKYVGENKLVLFMKKRLALADVERFKRNVREEVKSKKRPSNYTNSAHRIK